MRPSDALDDLVVLILTKSDVELLSTYGTMPHLGDSKHPTILSYSFFQGVTLSFFQRIGRCLTWAIAMHLTILSYSFFQEVTLSFFQRIGQCLTWAIAMHPTILSYLFFRGVTLRSRSTRFPSAAVRGNSKFLHSVPRSASLNTALTDSRHPAAYETTKRDMSEEEERRAFRTQSRLVLL